MTALLAAIIHFVIPAAVPVAAHVIQRVTDHLTGGAEPQSVAETVQLMQARTAQMQVLASLDAPGANCSRWVSDLRGSYRYFLATAVIVWAVIVAVYAPASTMAETAGDALTSVFSFFFMDRVMFNLSRSK